VNEIGKLNEGSLLRKDTDLKSVRADLAEIREELLDFLIRFTVPPNEEVVIDIRGQQVKYSDEAFHYANHRIPAPPIDGSVSLRALVDRASLELFANLGAASASFYFKPAEGERGLSLKGPEDLKVNVLMVHRPRSIWKE
jgi:sucrose-6-phosphate hydrolase SacC (GH32 family)